MKYLLHLLLFLPLLAVAQSGDMRVYTVAGWYPPPATIGDGGPATAAGLAATEGIWLDGNCNLFISEGASRIRKVDAITGIITTVAGTGVGGFSGDGGLATNARIKPYGLFAEANGNILIADAGNNRIRKVDVLTGLISTIAGGGTVLGDGGMATNALVFEPGNVIEDVYGNIYIGERKRIRKVDKLTGIINTIAGTGITGFSGDGGPATNAQIFAAQGMLFDGEGNLFFADRGNSRIRKINLSTNIITTIVGTTDGYSGDGGPATNAQLSGHISFVIDRNNNLIIGDNQNNYLRKVDAISGVITTIAGMGPSGAGSTAEGALATEAQIHPEFMYLDLQGNLYFSNYGWQIRKITNCGSALRYNHNMCGTTDVPEVVSNDLDFRVFPNPVYGAILTLNYPETANGSICVCDYLGRKLMEQRVDGITSNIDLSALNAGFYLVAFKGNNFNVTRHFVKLND